MSWAPSGGERGFTLFEVLIAMLLLAVGVLATITTFESSSRLTDKAEAQQAATDIAQRELESIRSLPYSAVALKSAPGTSLDPANPDYRVSNSVPVTYQWDQGSTATEPVVVDPAGALDPSGPDWSTGRLGGEVHRYVTWVDDPCTACASSQDQAITQDYKRVTVAVTVKGAAKLYKPVISSTIVADPAARKGQ